jgi:hypothetical protein
VRPPGLLHPHVQLLGGPLQRLRHVPDRPEVAEHQARRRERREHPQRAQGLGEVEIGRGRRRAQVLGLLDEYPGGVTHVQVAAGRVDEADVMLGVAGGVVTVQPPAAAEVDRAPLLHRPDAPGRGGCQHAEQRVQLAAVDAARAVHQPARIGQVPGPPLMDHDLGGRVHRGDVPHSAGVVQVDVGDHDGGQVPGADAQARERVADHRRRRRGARLDQARPLRPDQVAGGDLVVAGHPGVDLEHLVPEGPDTVIAGGAPFCLVHGCYRARRQPR